MSAGAEDTEKWWWPYLNNQGVMTRVLYFDIFAKYYTKQKKKMERENILGIKLSRVPKFNYEYN